MKMLTSEITKLLDKLYNLRGEDSVILSKMESERKLAEETKVRSESEKETLQEKTTAIDDRNNKLFLRELFTVFMIIFLFILKIIIFLSNFKI